MARSRKRRVNGEGSIYPRKDGRYEARAYVLGTDGVERRVSRYGRTYDEAHEKLVRLQADHHQGIPVPVNNLTLSDYLEHWLRDVVARKRPKTLVGYSDVVRLHISPVLGRKRLTKVTAQDVRRLIAHTEQKCVCCSQGIDARRPTAERRCCAVGQCCGKQLGTRMVQFTHAVLRNALENAVREELITRNVAKLVQVTSPDYRVSRGLAVADAYRVLEAAKAEDLSALYVLALYLGLRRAELLGLSWEDIVLEPERGHFPMLEVRRTVQRVNGRLCFVQPKTRTSIRTVPLPDICVQALKDHRKRQAEVRESAGAKWEENGLVFPSRVGTPMEPDNLRRSWGRIKAAAGVELRFHDMRHTCVTLLLNLGVPPHIVRDIAGHSALDVTMNIYAHVSLDEKYRALAKLDKRIAREGLASHGRQKGKKKAGK